MGGQRFVYQPASPQGQMPAQRPVRAVNFQKGPGGLGIRVIGGNQVGIFVSAVQEQSPADQNGIRVGDRIHAVNGVSIAGLTREEAFDILLSLGEQQIGLAVENCPEEFAQVKTGKFGDSFYIRAHFAHSKATPSRGHPPSQQPAELSFQPGDIFHVTDTLFGGSPGYWQVTKVYSAIDAEQQKPAGVGAGQEPNSGIVPHAKVAEQMLREQRMAAEKAANSNGGGMNGSAEGGGGTLSRSLFRKKLSLSSRKFFGGASNNAASVLEPPMEEVLSASGNYGSAAVADLVPPAYERVALKRPAFHRPVVLFGPLADVARQHLLTQSSLRFGAPLPSTPSANAAEPMIASTSSERGGGAGGIRLCAVDAVMAAQKHCCLCVSPGSVERLQLAQYAPIVILVDVDSRSRVRELRSKAGAATQSARKLMEQAARIKKHNSHLLTATLDASKEDQWFEALRALIFHLQERRVWMPEFQPEQPLDDMLLFSLPGETPTSDGDKSDYGIYEPGPSLNNGGTNNGTAPRQYQQSAAAAAAQQQSQQPQLMARMGGGGGHPNGGGGPFLVTNPAYSLAKQQQMQANNCAVAGNDHDDQHDGGGGGGPQQQLPSSSRPSQQPAMMLNSATIDSVSLHHHQYQHQNNSAARNSPYHPMGGGAVAQQSLSLYASPSNALSAATAAARASPREPTTKSQLLAQLATELGNGGGAQQKGGIPQQ